MQPFSQAYTPGQPQLAQQIVVPWQLVPQGIPAMQIVPQASPFANFPIQPISGLPPGYAPQMVFLRQATFSDKDKSKHFDSQKSR